MSRLGILLSTGCAVALVAAFVPAVASGTNVTAPASSSNVSIDDRKKPKPSKKPKPTKSPKPTQPSIPTPTVAIPPQVRAIEAWIRAQPQDYKQAPSTFVYTVDPALVGTQWEQAAKSGAKGAFEAHALLGQPVTKPLRVYLGWSGEWLKESLPKDVCPSFSPYGQASVCPRSDVIYTRYQGFQDYSPSLTPTSQLAPLMRFGVEGLLGHELTHVVQTSIYPQSSTRTYPAGGDWLVEGWAVMLQTMTAMRQYDIPYATARDYELRLMDAQCQGAKLKDLLAPAWFTNCTYLRGFLGMEYLMAKTGDMKAGWTWASQDAATAREAFAKAFPSLDMDTFMAEADAYADREIALWPQRLWPR
jgi:hypothetical protein